MSNTQETPETGFNRCSYVGEFLEFGRMKVKTCLSTSNDKHIEDLEYMLKSVRALINIINEIWENCKEHLVSGENNDNSSITFQNAVYEKVYVIKKDRDLSIATQKEFRTKKGSLPIVPEDLSKLLYFDLPESDVLPDYNKYLNKSSILCEEVLLPFLTSFQEHLKQTHVFLGKIEEWLLEPEGNIKFLEETFDGEVLKNESQSRVIVLHKSNCLQHVDCQMDCQFDLWTDVGRKGLKETLSYIKIYQPLVFDQVIVKNAGEQAVNGVYKYVGDVGIGTLYFRFGDWNGELARFFLISRKTRESIKWHINCRPCGFDRGILNFYETESTTHKRDEYDELPPMNGWKRGLNGIEPLPQIIYDLDE